MKGLLQTIRIYWRYVILSLKESFQRPSAVLWGLLVAVLVLILMILLPNHKLMRILMFSDVFTLGQKAKIFWSSLGAFQTNFTAVSRVSAVLVAFLSGINVMLFLQYFKKQVAVQKSAGASIIGMTIGFFGIGCSACGSVILSSVLGIGAATGLIGILPLKGLEFSILSVGILIWSVSYVAMKMQKQVTCNLRK